MNAWSDDRQAAANAVSLWISVWQRESGPDRADARVRAQSAIRYFKRFHREPERAAFRAAVRPQSLARERYEQAWEMKRELNQ